MKGGLEVILCGRCNIWWSQETSYRSCQETFYRDLVQGSCQETSYRDLVQRPGEEKRDLAQTFFIESLSRHFAWDLLQRYSVEISCRDFVQIALQRDRAQQLLSRTCQGDLAHDLLQRSSQRDFAESNLASLLPETTLTEHDAFTTRVTLVLLAWSHWWFWVLPSSSSP